MPARSRPTWKPGSRSACPIAGALDLLGDRWTLLVVRDLVLLGKRRFGEFLASPEAIPTNVLADRLRRLETCGLVEKLAYSERPRRFEYRPTAKGTALRPVLLELIRWGGQHLPGTTTPPPDLFEESESADGTVLSGKD